MIVNIYYVNPDGSLEVQQLWVGMTNKKPEDKVEHLDIFTSDLARNRFQYFIKARKIKKMCKEALG